jgi:hypothetical protein
MLRLITRFTINFFWLLLMLLKNGVTYLKEFNMKSLCTSIIRFSNISWLLVFLIDAKFSGHCPCFDFGLSSHIGLGTNKGNMMHCFVAYTLHLKREMQPTSNNVMSFSSLNIFNFKHCRYFLMTQPFFVKFMKIWKKNVLFINIQGQLKSHGHIQDFSNDHAKFEFGDGLLYRDGFLYVHDGTVSSSSS